MAISKHAFWLGWLSASTLSRLPIVRLDDELTDYEIARVLLYQGSLFWTAIDYPCFDIIQPPQGISRLRLSSYQFSADDYTTYRYDCAEILCNPRVARQGLMRGGILWRLAMEHASFQDVLARPATTATIQRSTSMQNVEARAESNLY